MPVLPATTFRQNVSASLPIGVTAPLLQAFERLKQGPDLLMVDGHGYAHPRRFGYACHLGLLLDLPTIGVAKSRLIGEAGTVAGPRGSRADIRDGGEVIGSMLR